MQVARVDPIDRVITTIDAGADDLWWDGDEDAV